MNRRVRNRWASNTLPTDGGPRQLLCSSRLVIGIILASLVAATAGCGASDEASRGTTPSDDTQSSSTTEVRENIHAAQQALVDQLLTRLLDAMSDGGVSSAITVCKSDAPEIAKSVGEQFGVRIGRTSFRLRNPENAPPEWARPLIEQRVEAPQFVDLDC